MTAVTAISDLDEPAAAHLPGDPDVWIFIIAELLMFGAFFVTYVVYRAAEIDLFNASQLTLDRGLGFLNTLFLVTSSWAVAQAVTSARRNERRAVSRCLAMAVALAAAFVVVKAFEYSAKFDAGITLSSNTFYMFYFSLTMIHLLHVIGGMIILTILWNSARRGAYHPGNTKGLETGASYWHMVDVLWIFLFSLLYLLR
jgi:nitric oxide reductase NorE protein